MKFKILEHFEVKVFPSKLNTLVDKETTFEYNSGDVITKSSGVMFNLLKQINDGDLVSGAEYEIIADVKIYDHDGNMYPKKVKIDDFSQLEGLNDLSFVWLVVE